MTTEVKTCGSRVPVPVVGAFAQMPSDVDAVADAMSSALINFARTGDPNGAGVPAWPKYELPGRVTMQWNTVSKATPDPRGEERRLVGLIPYRQPGT